MANTITHPQKNTTNAHTNVPIAQTKIHISCLLFRVGNIIFHKNIRHDSCYDKICAYSPYINTIYTYTERTAQTSGYVGTSV